MDVKKDTIEKVAKLARINLNDEEKIEFTKDLNEILKAFKKIDEVDVTNFEPSFQPIKITGHLREDIPKMEYVREDLFRLTKNKTDEYFKGPMVKK